jgi:hypothetical protein
MANNNHDFNRLVSQQQESLALQGFQSNNAVYHQPYGNQNHQQPYHGYLPQQQFGVPTKMGFSGQSPYPDRHQQVGSMQFGCNANGVI